MGMPKGKTGNPAGRPKNSPNKATKELRTVLSDLLSSEMTPAKLRALLNKLKPVQRIYDHFTGKESRN